MGCIVTVITHNRHSSKNVEGADHELFCSDNFLPIGIERADPGNVEGRSVTVRSSVGNRDRRQLVEVLQQLQRQLSTDVVRLRIRRVHIAIPITATTRQLAVVIWQRN